MLTINEVPSPSLILPHKRRSKYLPSHQLKKSLNATAPSFVPPSLLAAQTQQPVNDKPASPPPSQETSPEKAPAEPASPPEEIEESVSEEEPSSPPSPPSAPAVADTPSSPEDAAAKPAQRIKYDLAFMLQLGEAKFEPPPDLNFPMPTTPTSPKDRDRIAAKRPARALNMPPSPSSGGDLRSRLMGSKVVALEHRADVAFTAKKDDGEEAKALKKIKGILNRITPATYESLFDQLCATLATDKIDVMNSLEKIISIIFETALDQINYSSMYANICHDLCKRTQDQKQAGNDNDVTLQAFRRNLLTRCQQRFEEGCKHEVAPIPEEATDDEKESLKRKEFKYRQASIGNIKFISELFRRTLLSEKIMHAVIKQLLLTTNHTDASNVDLLEVLCTLLTSVGQRLDRPAAREFMDHYFEVMHKISSEHPVSRIRFLVLDVIELRKAGWVARAVGSKEVEDAPRKSDARSAPVANKEPFKGGKGDGWETVSKPTRPKKDSRPPASSGKSLADRAEMFANLGSSPTFRPSARNAGKPAGAGAGAAAAAAKEESEEAKEPQSPPAATEEEEEDDAVDVQFASKAKSLLENWTGEESADATAAFLADEIGGKKSSKFTSAMITYAVAKNNRGADRAKIVEIVEMWAKRELLYPRHLTKAFLLTFQESKELEVWTDVPKLWQNLSELAQPLLHKKLLPADSLGQLCDVLLSDELAAPESVNFLIALAQALEAHETEEEVLNQETAAELLLKVAKVLSPKTKVKAKALTVSALVKELNKLKS
eukprot:TRINITY_DN3449_c0_g1_i3.p1 TRINITY_DN3449_c0_g1~~TRINITY_DN3449_c0_g1_i3.p1  ORF type:complete len:774 (+),score=185.19 TRINITY_DN3449_c0_g1_i3:302-2623(+)